MTRNNRCVKFLNLSTSSLGVFSDECSTFFDMMNDIAIDKKQQLYIIKKTINIATGATYYIFCCRNKNCESPDLMQFRFSSLLLLLLLLFFLNNSIAKSICKLPNVYVARFTIVHSKTQMKFPLLFHYGNWKEPSSLPPPLWNHILPNFPYYIFRTALILNFQ